MKLTWLKTARSYSLLNMLPLNWAENVSQSACMWLHHAQPAGAAVAFYQLLFKSTFHSFYSFSTLTWSTQSVHHLFPPLSTNLVWWGLFPHMQGFGVKVWQYIPSLPPPPFLKKYFLVEISLSTPIPPFRPGSVHSGSASWDDSDCPWWVACELVSW